MLHMNMCKENTSKKMPFNQLPVPLSEEVMAERTKVATLSARGRQSKRERLKNKSSHLPVEDTTRSYG